MVRPCGWVVKALTAGSEVLDLRRFVSETFSKPLSAHPACSELVPPLFKAGKDEGGEE